MTNHVLREIADGKRAAMHQCIAQYGPLVWSLARRFTRASADAEDATQEIFLDVWRSAGSFDPKRGTEVSFIATIARRRLIDRIRRSSSEPVFIPFDAPEVSAFWSDPGTHSETLLDAEQALRAVKSLRPEHRQVIEMSLLQGLSQSEIAAALDMPLGTVKSFMRRGLALLRALLGERSSSSTIRQRVAVTISRYARGSSRVLMRGSNVHGSIKAAALTPVFGAQSVNGGP